jgi:hypothetical protein
MGLTLKNKPHLSVPRAMACDHNMGIPRLLAQHRHFTNYEAKTKRPKTLRSHGTLGGQFSPKSTQAREYALFED